MGRVQLVKSIVQGMVLYSFHCYIWAKSLLNTIYLWIRNFIWAGDMNSRKVCTVYWQKICSSFVEGALGLHSVMNINAATSFKLCWDIVSSNDQWSIFLKARFFKNNLHVSHYLSSSIWPGIKANLQTVKENVSQLLGNGSSINFWSDNWLSIPIAEMLHIPPQMHKYVKSIVDVFISDSGWSIPTDLVDHYPGLAVAINQVVIPLVPNQDKQVWTKIDSGMLSFKEAFLFLNPPSQVQNWYKLIWNQSIPPSKSFLVWRLLHRRVPTDENLQSRGCVTVSMCSLCCSPAETSEHLFLSCPFVVELWNSTRSLLNCQIDLSSFKSIINVCDQGWS